MFWRGLLRLLFTNLLSARRFSAWLSVWWKISLGSLGEKAGSSTLCSCCLMYCAIVCNANIHTARVFTLYLHRKSRLITMHVLSLSTNHNSFSGHEMSLTHEMIFIKSITDNFHLVLCPFRWPYRPKGFKSFTKRTIICSVTYILCCFFLLNTVLQMTLLSFPNSLPSKLLTHHKTRKCVYNRLRFSSDEVY